MRSPDLVMMVNDKGRPRRCRALRLVASGRVAKVTQGNSFSRQVGLNPKVKDGWVPSVTAGWRIEKSQGPSGHMERFATVAVPLRFATKVIKALGQPKSNYVCRKDGDGER